MEVWGGSVAGPSRPVLHGGCTDVHLDGSSGLMRELSFGCAGEAKLALRVHTSLLAYSTDKSGAYIMRLLDKAPTELSDVAEEVVLQRTRLFEQVWSTSPHCLLIAC